MRPWIQRIPRNGIDREIATPRGIRNRHRRIARDVEGFMAAADFRFTARQRHVDVADLEDLKTLADRRHAAVTLEQIAKSIRWYPEHLEVDVL